MDEATANIDFKTEEIIQDAIFKLVESNASTILTIAHRIKTIMNYDKIIVLENGQVIEFDSPKELLKDKNSYFYQLSNKSMLV